ncbi:MAG: class I SAM-dependent methyltransferase [Lachnospiraceae bacterium]|nr:class I SAM-dependent methyltransferase [Lachnospiraceae bacterium]
MRCRICNSENLESVIDLGQQPWANDFIKKEHIGEEPFYPLRVVYCHDCHAAQLDYTVKKEVMFGNHTYLTGATKTTSEHFKRVAQRVDEEFFSNRKDKSVLDIGSNDGTQLLHYQNMGYKALGVESSKITAEIANKAGVNTINEFFNLETVKKIDSKFDVINAAGVFYHLEEIHSVCEGIKEALKEDGVFVVHFIYMKDIFEHMTFDQIYHEHLLYYTLETIGKLLNLHGLEMFDAYHSGSHGGTIIGYVGHKGTRQASERLCKMQQAEQESNCNSIKAYRDFNQKIEILKSKTLNYLQEQKKLGKRIFGLGSPLKGNTLLNHFGIGTDILDCLAETNPLRDGLYSPGQHIPIVLQKDLKENPDIYFVLAWNFKNEILERNADLIKEGVEFYFPVDVDNY